MDLKKVAAELSEIERNTISALESEWLTTEQLFAATNINVDSVRRAIEWLREKELIDVIEEHKKMISLTSLGKITVTKGLPERRLIETVHALGGKAALDVVKEKALLSESEIHIALGIAKKNTWLSIHKNGKIEIECTGLEEKFLNEKTTLEIVLSKLNTNDLAEEELNENEKVAVKELLNRKLATMYLLVNRKVRLNANGIKVKTLIGKISERVYNIHAAVPRIFIGKKQPYIQFLSQIRKKLIALGFREMKTPLIVSEFYNFDVLFQPQNHPARTWADTYQLKQPKFGKLPNAKIVNAVKAAHENGGISESTGWGYKWSAEIASRLMPVAHATAHSARQLVEGIEIPGKYFAIGRCYRPDVVDASHLIEFNQLDGFVVGKELNFRHLLGILKQFAVEIAGAEKVRFYPDYYPFTEPSVQLSAKHPEMGWIEFAGAGIFRPEITENLGIKEPAIAWGMGIDRLAMFKLGIKDIRYLFSDDLGWLRNSKMVE